MAQLLRRLLMRSFRLTQLLRQARGVLLQGKQRTLTLFVLSDALVQLLGLAAEPGVAFVGVLIEQLRGQRMRLQARGQGLLLRSQLFLLLQQFFLLRDHATDFAAQLNQFFLELIDHLLGIGLFAFIVTAKALQQRFGLVIRMLIAAADRAGLIVLQLRAQLFDTGTARQPLTLEQFASDAEGLLGDGQFGLGFHAVLGQALALLLRLELTLLQLGAALVEILLRGPQARQVFDRAQLFAVVLQQGTEQADLFGDRIRLSTGLLEQHFQLLFVRGQFLSTARGVLFQRRQFSLTLVQAVTDQHQLLQTIAIGAPGIAQRRQMHTLLKLGGDALQTLGDLSLFFLQSLNRALAILERLLGCLPGIGAAGSVLDQAGEGALLIERLT